MQHLLAAQTRHHLREASARHRRRFRRRGRRARGSGRAAPKTQAAPALGLLAGAGDLFRDLASAGHDIAEGQDDERGELAADAEDQDEERDAGEVVAVAAEDLEVAAGEQAVGHGLRDGGAAREGGEQFA